MPEFLKMRFFLRIIFLASAFNQESDKTNHYISMSTKNKWTVEESNLRRAGLQPAALPSELTVQIRRYKIALPSILHSFFSIRVPVPSASVRKHILPGCSLKSPRVPVPRQRKNRLPGFLFANGLKCYQIIICNAIPAHISDINTLTVAYSTHIFVLCNR